eukprot:1159784-Pelagomonas_calceolata.AAC.6
MLQPVCRRHGHASVGVAFQDWWQAKKAWARQCLAGCPWSALWWGSCWWWKQVCAKAWVRPETAPRQPLPWLRSAGAGCERKAK